MPKLELIHEYIRDWISGEVNVYRPREVSYVPRYEEIVRRLQSVKTMPQGTYPINDRIDELTCWVHSAHAVLRNADSENNIDKLVEVGGRSRDPLLLPCTAAILYHLGKYERVVALVSHYLDDDADHDVRNFLSILHVCEVLSPQILGSFDKATIERMHQVLHSPDVQRFMVHAEWASIRSDVDHIVDADGRG
jgi:hypothetical protein